MNLDDDFDTVDELPAQPRRSIPEADRELLELAARALGAVRVEDVGGEEWVNLHFADGSIRYGWNPLLHSDDMLNLIVALNLHVQPNFRDGWNYVLVGIDNPDRDQYLDPEVSKWLIEEDGRDDPPAATRRAVTRAAAKIGSSMQ